MSQFWDDFCKCIETQGKPGEEAFEKYLIKKYGAKNVKDVAKSRSGSKKALIFWCVMCCTMEKFYILKSKTIMRTVIQAISWWNIRVTFGERK